MCVSISRGATMEIADTSTRRYDAPTPHVEHDITRFFRPCNSLFEISLSKHLPVFVPAFAEMPHSDSGRAQAALSCLYVKLGAMLHICQSSSIIATRCSKSGRCL